MKRVTLLLMTAVLAMLAAPEAAAQSAGNWPRQRPITFVVPTPAGGSNDATGRAVAEALGRQLGQTIVVDNRPGAAGSIAMEFVSKAPADGYTFVVASDSVSLQPVLRKTVTWSVERDFVPVIMFGTQPIVVATYAASPYKSIQDLVRAAKARPGSIGYATSGQGSIQHLAGELLGEMAGIDLLHIPYKGGGQAISDLVGGQVPVAILGMAAVLPHVKSGRARILAVTTRTRSKAAPDAPTLDESVAKGYDVRQWAGLMAPARTPPEILSRFADEAARALATPVTQERFDSLGFDVSGMSGGEFQGYLRADRERWSRIIADRKLQLD
jgi:tripartite-type tricarboxylate transporter receptor subunit TctC